MRVQLYESSLSIANEKRHYRIYEGLGLTLIKIVRPMYSQMRFDYIAPQDHDIFALDSKDRFFVTKSRDNMKCAITSTNFNIDRST